MASSAMLFAPFIWYIVLSVYVLVTSYTIFRILLDTASTSKTLAYLLLVTVLPFIGVAFYFSFGLNTRHSLTNKKLAVLYDEISEEFNSLIEDKTDSLIASNSEFLSPYVELVRFLKNLGGEHLTSNDFKLLLNGEAKFPEVLDSLKNARHHIHMEYYAWENDIRGNEIKNILLEKARQGVKVRAIFDAYASRKITHNIVKELRAGGVEIYPAIKLKLVMLANRLNHRDHRKVIIIDGRVGFVGGINLSDRYDNSIDTGLYWRDTHIKISGPGVMNLQRHFLVSWRACQSELLHPDEVAPTQKTTAPDKTHPALSQIIAGGPIYSLSNIMLSYSRVFTLAREKLYITNPYFIPNETILDSLKQAAKSGVDVRLLVPEKSDSRLVGEASKYYFKELLLAGVRIFQYQKGFVHAKTVVADGKLSIVGTANMDIRSFDLNFEIMSVVYSGEFAREMENAFISDLKESTEIDAKAWLVQSRLRMLLYAIARLISSFL